MLAWALGLYSTEGILIDGLVVIGLAVVLLVVALRLLTR